jgi:hypothetical protein
MNVRKGLSAMSSVSVTLVLLAACSTRATMLWKPSVVSQVPDSTPVRYRVDSNTPMVRGLALDWTRRTPRLMTALGDTVSIPESARLEVRLRQKSGHPITGAVVGYVAGVITSYAYCPPPKTHCGEQDPTPLLGAALGAWVGSWFRSYPWVQVRRESP